MVSKIRLPKLEKKEEAAVTSSVIDVFYRPEKKPISPVLGDLARSLSGVIPQLQAYENVQEEIEKTEQESKADVDFRNENIKDFRKLVKAGKIPEGANPYYIRKYVENSLREKANEFEAQMWDSYQNQGIDTAKGSSAFNDFYRSFAEQFAKDNKLELYDNVSIAEGFIPYAEGARTSLQSQHIQQRVSNIEKGQKDSLELIVERNILGNKSLDEASLDRALVNYPNLDTLSIEDKITLYSAQTIQKEIDDLIAVGMDEKTANDTVVSKVIRIAEIEGDDSILDVLENIITDGEARLSGSYKDDILEAQYKITEIQDNRANSAWIQNERGKKLRKEEVLNTFIYQDEWMLDIEHWMEEYNLRLILDKKPILRGEEKLMLRELSKSYITGLNAENIIQTDTTKEYVQDIYETLATNPQDPLLLDKIRTGWGKMFTTVEGKTMFTTYYSRSKLEMSPYFTDQRYSTIQNGLEEELSIVIDEVSMMFPEHVVGLNIKGKIILQNEAYDLVQAMSDPAFLDKHKLITDYEKRDFFFERLEKMRRSIVQIILPKEISAIREKNKLKINEMESLDIINPKSNPYD